MKSSDKSVFLISNDDSITESTNTLTSFSGSVPENFLNPFKTWKVAVHSCGFHLTLKQPISPKYEIQPSVIQITYKNLDAVMLQYELETMEQFKLHMFEDGLKLYVDKEKSYTSKTLAAAFKMQALSNQIYKKKNLESIPIRYNESSDMITFGQFELDGTDSDERISKLPRESRKDARSFVFMNKYFKEGIDVQHGGTTDFHTIKIDGELYYFFFNSKIWKSKPFYPFQGRQKSFPVKEPSIIQITSPDIKHNINNGVFRHCLSQFTVKESDIRKYIHREFNQYEFFDVLNNSIKGFRIKFVDENLQQIRLNQGLPSWIKLIFTSSMDFEENIRISSEPNDLYPENDMSNFGVELKKPIDFTWKNNPRVALTRVSFKNKWKLMPGLRLNFFVYNMKNKNFHNFECPREHDGPRSCEDVVRWFQDLVKEKYSMRVVKQQLNGNWSLIFSNKSIIIIGRDLAQCLGFSFAQESREDLYIHSKKENFTNVVDENNVEDVKIAISEYTHFKYGVKRDVKSFQSTGDVVILGESESILHLDFPPRIIEIFPNEIYIYCNFVKSNVVMGQYRQLLKVVPLPYKEKDENITVDFSKLEYHTLSELQPRFIKFKIATVDGLLIEPYDKADNMYLNLRFCYE